MKIARKIVLLASILPAVFLCTTCSNERYFEHVTWEGHLYDTIGGKPVEGYWISLRACVSGDAHNQCDMYEVGRQVTDGSGYFKIHNLAARSDRYHSYWGNASFYDVSRGQLSQYSTIYLKNK